MRERTFQAQFQAKGRTCVLTDVQVSLDRTAPPGARRLPSLRHRVGKPFAFKGNFPSAARISMACLFTSLSYESPRRGERHRWSTQPWEAGLRRAGARSSRLARGSRCVRSGGHVSPLLCAVIPPSALAGSRRHASPLWGVTSTDLPRYPFRPRVLP